MIKIAQAHIKRLQTTQAQLQEIFYAQAQTHETSYAQAQLQGTSIQTKLQTNMFEVEHLIYNQWCSQYNSEKTLKILEFLRYESCYEILSELDVKTISAEFQHL